MYYIKVSQCRTEYLDWDCYCCYVSHSNLKMEIIKGISGFTSVTLEKKCMNEKPRPNFDTPELHSPNVFISYFFLYVLCIFFASLRFVNTYILSQYDWFLLKISNQAQKVSNPFLEPLFFWQNFEASSKSVLSLLVQF